MRILYGVAGEGLGHATRSRVVIDHLRARGHAVLVVVSGRAHDVLRRVLPGVVEIDGLELAYRDGALDLGGSLARNARKLPRMLARNAAVAAAVDGFGPDAVVSDFETFAALHGAARGLPVASVDNLHMVTRCAHDPALLGSAAADHGPAAALVALKLPRCVHYVVTTFFCPPVRPECRATTTLVPPVVRAEVAAARPRDDGHVLVYQTALGDSRLLEALARHPRQRFVVYGLRRDETRGNCALKGFREQEFVDDLAGARAVVANGGMSLLGEAVYLGKPVYAVPVRDHFEQAMNARYLAALGYGATSDRFDAGALGAFLRAVPWHAERLRPVVGYDGNRTLYATLDRVVGLLARGGAAG